MGREDMELYADSSGVLIIILTTSDKILVTTFRQCVVPPPMCAFELQLSSPVNQVTFLCQPQRTNQLAALTSDGQISVYSQGGLYIVSINIAILKINGNKMKSVESPISCHKLSRAATTY